MGFTGNHARRHGPGIAVHLLGKPAHKNLLGSSPRPNARNLIFRPLGNTSPQARKHGWAAVRSRIGDAPPPAAPGRRPVDRQA
ncbi:acyl-CoA synthetase [Mycobacterium intracellulare subsp. intracellulare MTCC 9506]|uniref:Acyl-CoA synthetase n=1 Tax=Mycobacterium indicus pranii (strain DSM 45239 / MTCC 9506) TaxID=1232724 RepID=J9WCY1_MYCIP|nr:acyl-CoA synthetase [Mycobacterium intracellulare subsp. intracellulare MTCC 9506]